MKTLRFTFLLFWFLSLSTVEVFASLSFIASPTELTASHCMPYGILSITLPFWSSWWLTAFMALLVTLVVFFYIRLRTNSLINQNIQLEEKVNLLTLKLQERKNELPSGSDAKLRLLQNQLIVNEKMASLGQLTAGIAHEIQNPLNFINNFSELSSELLDELDATPEESEKKEIIKNIRENLEKISVHGKRADSIVKGILLQSRKVSGEKIPTDINKLVDEFFILAYHGMRAKDPGFNCVLEKNLEPGLPAVSIIPQEINRVFLNIFNNAFYAVDERSKSENKKYQPIVSITTRKTNGNIDVVIRDNGKGISTEIREKIFAPFFTTKPAGEGTGLGLSISHEIIVKGHNGALLVDSIPGEFTEFCITLPIKS